MIYIKVDNPPRLWYKKKVITNHHRERGEYHYESVLCKKPCNRKKIHNQRNGTGWNVCSSPCSNITDFTANADRSTDHHPGICVGAVLGSRLGTTATLVYVLLGAIGLLIVETIGGLQWHFVGGSMSIPAIAVYSLTAFIPKDIVITVLAVLIAIPIRKGINNAGNRW